MLFCCHMRVAWVAEWAKYPNKHKKCVTSKRNDSRPHTQIAYYLSLFRGFDGVFEFERVESQISSTLRTHTFTLT